MNILVTGAKGFLGKNLSVVLSSKKHQVFEYDVDSPKQLLLEYVQKADFVVHLAGANRPLSKDEFYQVNANFTYELTEMLRQVNNKASIIFSSSIQAELSNDYGKSKKMAEDFLFSFQQQYGNKTYIYRLSNVFGKWSRPNYNSVVATFCSNISRHQPIFISDSKNEIPLVYVDDVVKEFVSVIEGEKVLDSNVLHQAFPIFTISLGDLSALIQSFEQSRINLSIPDMQDALTKRLYATYLSFIDPKDFAYALKMNEDVRGSFTEFIRVPKSGQISVNITKAGITKGNHYHHTKNEKFLVVYGEAEIRLRKVGESEVVCFNVNGQQLTVVDIPPGYTHYIKNVGSVDLVTVIWANEPFNPNNPDTIYLEV